MLFVTASEILTRYPECNVYYTTPTREIIIENNGMKLYQVDKYSFIIALGMKAGAINRRNGFFELSKQALKALITRNFKAVYSGYGYDKLIESLDLILDVSGFNLSSLFSIKGNDYYLRTIFYAYKCGIPIILLPQSFGPFNYKKNNSKYIPGIHKIMQYPKLIFAREKEGYDLLTKQLGLKNVCLSNDLVLQNKKIHWELIFESSCLPKQDINIITHRNVGIIPNMKIIDKCPHIDIYRLYHEIICSLLYKNRTVYLIYHSSEDYYICKKIKANFKGEQSVILLKEELNCYDYEHIICDFDYIVASRFHSIVHAFKQNIPCLGLGWAEKYQELFNNLGQQQYVLDMRKEIACSDVLERLTSLEQNYETEKPVIKEKLEIIQQDNCFDKVFDLFKKQGI